jgi:hypothetical protein
VTRLNWKFIPIHLDIVLILTQDMYTVCAKHTIDLKIIWTHLMELLGDLGHVESCYGPFGDIVCVSAR